MSDGDDVRKPYPPGDPRFKPPTMRPEKQPQLVREATDPIARMLLTVNRQRGSVVLAMLVDGLEGLLQNAHSNDPHERLAARAVFRRLFQIAGEIEGVLAIADPAEDQGAPPQQ